MGWSVLAQKPTDEEIARQFVSKEIVAEAESIDDVRVRTLRADLDATARQDYLIAAFSAIAGQDAEIVVIRLGEKPIVVAREGAFGSSPGIELMDLDHDGKPEVVVNCNFNHGSAALVFGWRRGTLVSMNEDFIPSPWFRDLDGDGIVEAIEAPNGGDYHERDIERRTVLRLIDGFYKPAGELYFLDRFRAGLPAAEERRFNVEEKGPYILTVLNGDDTGKNHVRSATITLNGKLVAGPDDFAGSRPVKVAVKNKIQVVLTGRNGRRSWWPSARSARTPPRAAAPHMWSGGLKPAAPLPLTEPLLRSPARRRPSRSESAAPRGR